MFDLGVCVYVCMCVCVCVCVIRVKSASGQVFWGGLGVHGPQYKHSGNLSYSKKATKSAVFVLK